MTKVLCCFCKENSDPCSATDALVGCTHDGCTTMVHAKCVGLTACIRNIIQGKDDPVFCAHHWTDVARWNDRTAIEVKHLMQGLAEYTHEAAEERGR